MRSRGFEQLPGNELDSKKASPGLALQGWLVVADEQGKRLGFVQSPQAPCAELLPLGPTVLVNCDLLDVWFPLTFGSNVRVADAMSKRRSLAAHFTFRHDCTSPT